MSLPAIFRLFVRYCGLSNKTKRTGEGDSSTFLRYRVCTPSTFNLCKPTNNGARLNFAGTISETRAIEAKRRRNRPIVFLRRLAARIKYLTLIATEERIKITLHMPRETAASDDQLTFAPPFHFRRGKNPAMGFKFPRMALQVVAMPRCQLVEGRCTTRKRTVAKKLHNCGSLSAFDELCLWGASSRPHSRRCRRRLFSGGGQRGHLSLSRDD